MKQLHSLLFGILALIGVAYFAPAHADVIGCKVYATQPSNAFAVNSTPQVPCDKNGSIWTNTAAAAGGTSSNFAASFPSAGTAAGFLDSTGLLMAPGKVDASNNLNVNCAVGCAGGTNSNGASNVSPTSTNGASNSWLYGFDAGGKWDQLQVDNSKYLMVNIAGSNATVPVSGTFWQATQPVSGPLTNTQLRASAVPVDGSGVVQPVSGTFWQATQPVSAASLPLPSGASTAGNQSTAITALGTINTTLGSPLQAGGTVVATQATGSNLHVVCDSGCAGSGGTSSNFGSAFPSAGTAIGASDGTNMKSLKVDGSQNLLVNCSNCSGSGVSNTDEGTFTAGSSLFASGGGFYQTTATSNPLTTGQYGTFQLTANRALFTNLRNASGAEIGVAAVPLQVSLANTAANSTAVKVDGSAVTQPVSGTFWQTTQPVSAASLPLPTNAAQETGGNLATLAGAVTSSKLQTNEAQIAGTAVSVNSGVKDAGTQRIVIATDQPQLTNALKVDGSAVTQPVSGTFWQTTQPVSAVSLPLPSNAAIETGGNLATLAGAVTASVVQDNEKQINGVTPLMNNGASGTGSQRINVANDNNAIPAWGQGATGSAPPSGAIYNGADVGGNLTGVIGCGSSIAYDASTSGSTQLVALSGSTSIYVCGYSIIAAGTVNVKLIYGTGTACVTSPQNITPAWELTAQAGLVDGAAFFRGLRTTSGQELCINTNGAVAVQAIVYYTQF